jgi:uncharacterized Zn finger protein (UPF0148 family)
MSDFDREAEREKLREKYEADKQKREASERMSELLLQGATMTNRHCPECHSPVFRYDGRAFCPTCEMEVTEDGELLDPENDSQEASEAESEAEAEVETGEPATKEGTEPTEAGIEEDGEQIGTEKAEERPEAAESGPPAPVDDRRPARVDPPAPKTSEPTETESDQERRGIDSSSTRRAALQESEETLVREIQSLTRRAAETRDVGRKRDLLAAAREAAETLETVRRL